VRSLPRSGRSLTSAVLLAAAVVMLFDRSVSGAAVALTATVCARGIDTFPGDGVFDSVFVNGPCSLFAAPASVTMASEERVAVEFPFSGSSLNPWLLQSLPALTGATLVLSPSGGATGNVGLAADEAVEVWIYYGDGTISVDDLHTAGKVFTALLNGPTADGAVSIAIGAKPLTLAMNPKLHRAPAYLGVMLKARRGVSPVSLGFAGADAATPVTSRPRLQLIF